MNKARRENLILSLYLQTRGFAFVLFEGWEMPIDWAVQDVRGLDKNAQCLKRIRALLDLHNPRVMVLQETSEDGTRRAMRIRNLNRNVAYLAEARGIAVRTYARSGIRQSFTERYGATSKRMIADTIANELPDLALYLPPARKPWMSEHTRMGIFEAAALAWMYFQETEGGS
ncbi:MAG TPA: hypothetical protein VH678_32020 [Xanthobacteraceae bacterium]|jgi:hypothetical protein